MYVYVFSWGVKCHKSTNTTNTHKYPQIGILLISFFFFQNRSGRSLDNFKLSKGIHWRALDNVAKARGKRRNVTNVLAQGSIYACQGAHHW